MQKKEKINFYFFFMSAITCVFLTSGCSYVKTYVKKVKEWNETPPILDVPREAVHQIDMMELKEVPKEEPVVDVKDEPELPEITLSLEECRALILENNLDLRVQRINPTIARESVNQEEAKFEAAFESYARYQKTGTPTATALEGSSSDTGYVNLGVNIPLRTGGTLSFGMMDYRNKTNSAWSLLNPSYTSDFSASISQPLLRNAGKRASTYNIRVAQYNSMLSNVQSKLQAIGTITSVDRAYWGLYATRKMLEVRKQQYDLSEAQYEQSKRFVEVGTRPKIELIRTRSDMAAKLEAIIKAENSVRDTERLLKRMLNKKGLGMESKTILIPSTLPDPVHYEFDRMKMVKNAIENRMELLELELRLAQDDNNIGNLKNQTLPQATFEYNYNLNGLGPQRGDAYDMLSDHEYNDHRFDLRFSIPIGNKAAKSRLRKARYERAKRLTTKESKENEITNDVLNQIDQLEANWQRILASRQSTLHRDELYKAEKRQFELGLVTSTDVLEAQSSLGNAQEGEIRAITDYQIALIDLARATGTLLGAAKVEWEPVVPVN